MKIIEKYNLTLQTLLKSFGHFLLNFYTCCVTMKVPKNSNFFQTQNCYKRIIFTSWRWSIESVSDENLKCQIQNEK